VEPLCHSEQGFSRLPAGRQQVIRPGAVSTQQAVWRVLQRLSTPTGHETGDPALRLFARVLRDSLRGHDLISRYGGEEFAIAFPDCSSVDATRALTTVQAQLDAAITVGGLQKFTSSYGITEIEPGEELAGALRRADDALLLAMRSGRNQIVLHDPETGANAPVSNGSTTNEVEELLRAERL
jgi:predicted signal transduction protein with EAL and GGDEF domain